MEVGWWKKHERESPDEKKKRRRRGQHRARAKVRVRGVFQCALCNAESLLCFLNSSIFLNWRWQSKQTIETGSPCANSSSVEVPAAAGC